MTPARQKLAQRRQAIAKDVSDGVAPDAAARLHGVSMSLVYESCKEHDVMPPPRVPRSARTVRLLQILARLQNSTESGAAIARDLGVSRQAVNDILQRALAAGIRFPGRRLSRERNTSRPATAGTPTSSDFQST